MESFTDLFSKAAHPLAIDTYQRPYVWNADKVDKLINDLKAHARQTNQELNYYMGAVLLHQTHEKLFIIDGQQRLTSLCILHYILTGELPGKQALSYGSPESVTNIKQVQVRARLAKPDLQQIPDLFKRICFTVIKVYSEDLAFTFFDIQNNRGVRPGATDLLRAYHLRAIGGPDSQDLQSTCAERWEDLQNHQIPGYGADFAPALFHQFLWRARQWTGQKLIAREKDDIDIDIINEFQKHSILP